jgi:hypothetical protein
LTFEEFELRRVDDFDDFDDFDALADLEALPDISI